MMSATTPMNSRLLIPEAKRSLVFSADAAVLVVKS
jgi:hypothetical protein